MLPDALAGERPSPSGAVSFAVWEYRALRVLNSLYLRRIIGWREKTAILRAKKEALGVKSGSAVALLWTRLHP